MEANYFKLSCELLVYLDRQGDLENMRCEAERFNSSLSEKNISNFPPFSHWLLIDVLHLIDQCPELGDLLLQWPCKVEEMCGDLLHSCLLAVSRQEGRADAVARRQLNVVVRLKCVPTLLALPNLHHYSGLITIQGLVIAVTKPSSYIAYSVWACPEGCEGNEVVMHHLPEHAPKCYRCGIALFENSRLRRCGDRVTATVRVEGQLQPRLVLVSDDLIQHLLLGLDYCISGVVYKKNFHAWSVETVAAEASLHATMPPGIRKLYKGAGDAEQSLVHVLVEDTDGGFVERIMMDAAGYATRSVFVGGSSAEAAAALPASSGGVCVLPLPMHAYRGRFAHAMTAAMEKREVLVDGTPVSLRSAVWAHGSDQKNFRMCNIARVFGVTCGADSAEESHDLADFILQGAIDKRGPGREEREMREELRAHLEGVGGLEVRLGPSAEELLKSYFLAARKEPGGVCATAAPALARLCLAAARACGRAAAAADDALLAIWLHAAPRHASPAANFAQWERIMADFKTWLSDYLGGIIDLDHV